MAVDFSNMTPEQQQQFLVEQGRLREQIETEAKRQEAMRKVLQIARQRGYLDPRDVDNFGLDYDEVNSLFRAGQIKPISTPVPSQPPVYDGFGGIKTRREKLQEAIENSNANNPYLGGNYGSRRPGWGLVDENPQPQAPVKSAGKSRRVRQGRSSGNLSRSGSNTYATAGTPRGGVISPATMMRTSGVQPVQASYGNNAPMGEGFDYTRTYDPMSNSMRPNDSYSYYDPSRNAPSGGDGTDLTLTYDPMTGQMVRR